MNGSWRCVGPYAEENACYIKYGLTLVEDHIKNIWTYLLQSKELSMWSSVHFIHMVQTQFNKHIKCSNMIMNIVHPSNVILLFSDDDIIHQKSCDYTSKQNGIVERRHTTLLEWSWVLMFWSVLPLNFWPFSILTAAWILNRIPSHMLDRISPYEVLFGDAPDYSQMKPFGCPAYCHILIFLEPHEFSHPPCGPKLVRPETSYATFLPSHLAKNARRLREVWENAR